MFQIDPENPTPLGDYMKSPDRLELDLIAPGVRGIVRPTFTLATAESVLNGLPLAVREFESAQGLGEWSLGIDEDSVELIPESLRCKVVSNGSEHWRLKPEVVDDVFLVCSYLI